MYSLYLSLHSQRGCQGVSESLCVHSGAAQQGRVLQQRHQLHRTRRITLCLRRLPLRLPGLLVNQPLRVTQAAQPGSERSLRLLPLDLLPLRVVSDVVTLQTLFHGEGFPTACVGTGEGSLLFVEGADVALQVEHLSEGSVTSLSGAFEYHPGLRVHVLMLLQEPGVLELLVALLTLQCGPVLLLPVLQILRPRLPCEAAALLLAGVTLMHLLMSLQLTGHSEPHLTAFMSALIRG